MRNTLSRFALSGMLMLGMNCAALAQDQPMQGQNQGSRGLRSIDGELEHLTKELELTPDEQKQVRPLLLEHHDEIQALFDKNPGVPRQALSAQIRAISDQTHHKIEGLLTDHQKQLAKAMQARMHHGANGESAPSTPPQP
jgi:protein CpxP